MKYKRDADSARVGVLELMDRCRAGITHFDDSEAIIDCRNEIFSCIDSLEEEITSLRSEINALTDSRWDDPHP